MWKLWSSHFVSIEMGDNVGKTMPFLPPMTGNGKHTSCKKRWWLGDGLWNSSTHISRWSNILMVVFQLFGKKHCSLTEQKTMLVQKIMFLSFEWPWNWEVIHSFGQATLNVPLFFSGLWCHCIKQVCSHMFVVRHLRVLSDSFINCVELFLMSSKTLVV